MCRLAVFGAVLMSLFLFLVPSFGEARGPKISDREIGLLVTQVDFYLEAEFKGHRGLIRRVAVCCPLHGSEHSAEQVADYSERIVAIFNRHGVKGIIVTVAESWKGNGIAVKFTISAGQPPAE